MDEPLDDSFTLSRVTLIAQASLLPVRMHRSWHIPARLYPISAVLTVLCPDIALSCQLPLADEGHCL